MKILLYLPALLAAILGFRAPPTPESRALPAQLVVRVHLGVTLASPQQIMGARKTRKYLSFSSPIGCARGQ